MSAPNYLESDVLDLENLVDSKKSNFKKTNHFQLKEGTARFRLLVSPIEGKAPFKEHWVHWFQYETQAADGSLVKTYRTGLSPYAIEGKCALREKASALRAELNKIAAPFTTESIDANGNKVSKINFDKMPKEVSQKYSSLAEQANKFKAQRHYYVNAVNESGELGVLKLPKTAYDALFAEIKRLVPARSKNPLALSDGVWFEFSRTGKTMRDTKYTVQVHRINKTVDGEVVEVINRAPIADELKKNYATVGADLDKLFKQLTYEDTVKILKGDYSAFSSRPKNDAGSSVASDEGPATVAADNNAGDLDLADTGDDISTIEF